MVRKNIGNWKKRFQPIITIDSWDDTESRDQFLDQILARRNFPRAELMDVLANIYTLTDRAKRQEILDAIGFIFRKANDSEIPNDLLELFRSSSDPDLRLWIISNLPKFSDDGLVPEIVDLLRSQNRNYRKAALSLLDYYDPDIVVDCLASELTQSGWADRSEPLRYLNELAPDKLLDPCRQALTIGNEQERLTSVELLAELRNDTAMAILKDASADSSYKVRRMVASAVGRIPGETSIEILSQLTEDSRATVIIEALKGLKRLGDEQVIPVVIKCAGHDDSEVRAQSLATIAEIGSTEQVDLIIAGIKDPDIHIRQSALQATVTISQKENIDFGKLISQLMSDEDVNVRRAAAQILGEVHAPELFGKIFQYLQDSDWWVREMIANALAKVNDHRVFPAVVQLLKHPDPSLRRYAIDILITIGNRRAVVSLLPLLKDQDWWVRERAVIALGKLGNEEVIPILANLLTIPELTYVSAEAMGEIGAKSAIAPLVEHLPKASTDSKISIMAALERIQAFEAIPILQEYLVTDDRDVRNKAKEVLARLKVDPSKIGVKADRWWEQHELSILDTMLMEVRLQNGRELFLVSNQPALARQGDELKAISREVVSEEQILSMVSSILTSEQEQLFIAENVLDFSYFIKGGGRFRGNMMRHADGVNLMLRILPDELPDLSQLDLPEYINELAQLRSGLVLIVGPAVAGKTTTVAALLNQINETRNDNIITIENPIEYVHSRKKCLVTQREIGRHTPNTSRALRAALREDPDVIFVGDLDDRDTISMVLTAAETGHFVLATMQSISTVKTLERIINSFPTNRQDLIRTMLSESLRAIVSQNLVTRESHDKPVVASEVLVNTKAIAGLIRENKLYQIPSLITSGSRHGMISMDQSLIKLVKEKRITRQEALGRAMDKKQFESYLRELGDI